MTETRKFSSPSSKCITPFSKNRKKGGLFEVIINNKKDKQGNEVIEDEIIKSTVESDEVL